MCRHLLPPSAQQARALGKHIRTLGPAFRADAVIVSPLTRTLETAAGVFGAGPWQSGDPQPPLMREQVGRGWTAPSECSCGELGQMQFARCLSASNRMLRHHLVCHEQHTLPMSADSGARQAVGAARHQCIGLPTIHCLGGVQVRPTGTVELV